MGKVVGCFGTAHVLFNPEGVKAEADQIFAGMQELGRRVQATRPDVIVVITSDHMFNINMAWQIPICVGVADEWVPTGDLNTGTIPFPGHRMLAETFVEHAAKRGFDITKSEELRPDHGVTLPLLFMSPQHNIPVVPILLNANMMPLPEPARCYALGQVLKEAIEEKLPAETRVAVVGTGGLSHWLFVPRMGEVNVEFDRNFMRQMAAGHAAELARMTAAEVVEQSGNGGIEIVSWLMAAATLPGTRGEEIYYVPMNKWSTGMGGLAIVP